MKLGATFMKVARLAQVSQSAVSRTFTPRASVSEETRKKVMIAARVKVFSRAVGHYSFEGVQTATRLLFKHPTRRPDAVFVAHDHMAIAAMDVLRLETGLRVPQDVSVVGFDDVPQAAWGAHQLTTVVQSLENMVNATVDLINDQMQAEIRPGNVMIPCRLIERQSVCAFSEKKTS